MSPSSEGVTDPRGLPSRFQTGVACLATPLCLLAPGLLAAQEGVRFTEVAHEAGARLDHAFAAGLQTDPQIVSGGVAAGDYNRDGWVDLYVIRGDQFPNSLLRNLGNGRFEEVAEDTGVAVRDPTSGPSFFDYNGDGWLDLLVGGIHGTEPRLFRNRDGEVFEDVTGAAGIFGPFHSMGHVAADFDRDGDLDIFIARWGSPVEPDPDDGHLFRNLGDGTFRRIPDAQLGLDFSGTRAYYSFAPNFADINGDGWLDLLLASDFLTSRVFLSQGDGTFADATTEVISDENGMGSAIADYDRDGDLDWFVTSIWDPNQKAEGIWGISGNRLYRNRGDGTFEDATTEAGVRRGFWGWAACFADFNNDTHPDLFHVNGFVNPITLAGFASTAEFENDPSRLFLANGDGTFTEQSAEVGIDDTGQGRGVVCFDYDRDGDVDIFVANNTGPTKLYRNDTRPRHHFLNVSLRGPGPNTQGVGAAVTVRTAGGPVQREEMRLNCNYVSHQPAELHFGLGAALVVEELIIEWPGGETDVFRNVPADEFVVAEPGGWVLSNVRACAESSTSLCLQNGRFEVTATFETADGASAAGQVRALGPGEKAGYFWFNEADNPELVVKVIDACIFGGRYWVFAGGLTHVAAELQVVDRRTGEVRLYRGSPGLPLAPVQDTGAFATCP